MINGLPRGASATGVASKRERPSSSVRKTVKPPALPLISSPSLNMVRGISKDARLLVHHLNDVSVSVEPAKGESADAPDGAYRAAVTNRPGLEQSDGEEEDVELVQTDGLELFDDMDDNGDSTSRTNSGRGLGDSQMVHASNSASSLRTGSAPQLPLLRMGSSDVESDAYTAGTSLESGLKDPHSSGTPMSPRDTLRTRNSAGGSSDGRASKTGRSQDGREPRRDTRRERSADASARQRERERDRERLRRGERRVADPSRPHADQSFPPPRGTTSPPLVEPPSSGRRNVRRTQVRAPESPADDSTRGRRGLLNILGLSTGGGGVTQFRWPATAEQSLLQVARVLSQRMGYPVLVNRSENKVKCAVHIAQASVTLSISATYAEGQSKVVIRRGKRDRSNVPDEAVDAFAARVYDLFLEMNRETGRRGGGSAGGSSSGRRARGTAVA